jgi:hypothetical protein
LPTFLNFKNFENRNLDAPVRDVENRTREVALGDEVYSILRKLKATRIRIGNERLAHCFFPQALGPVGFYHAN